MARLVARALRVGRSALIQTDSLAAYQGTHRLSYLIPALLWPEPAILALPDQHLETVLQQDIPALQQSLPIIKAVRAGDRWPSEDFRGLLVTSARGWVCDRIQSFSPFASSSSPSIPPHSTRFPPNIPTLIDGASDFERWVRAALSVSLSVSDWEALMLAYPGQRSFIRDMRVRLTHAIFQHPVNPYSCHLIDHHETELIGELYETLQAHGDGGRLPASWQAFWQRLSQPDRLAWIQLNRDVGSMVLSSGPTDIDTALAPIWQQQPVVLMGADLDSDPKSKRYRQRLGLGDMTCLRFGPDRHHDMVQLYLPDRLPMPNTSHFKSAVLQEIRKLLCAQLSPQPASSQLSAPVSSHLSAAGVAVDPGDSYRQAGLSADERIALTNPAEGGTGPTVIIVGDVPAAGRSLRLFWRLSLARGCR